MLRFTPSDSMLAIVALGVIVVVFALTLVPRRRTVAHGRRLLPGPTPIPFIGSALSIDPMKPWITYTQWKARYGDIFMARLLNQNVIVINSEKIAKELLERRSNIYSDRPYISTRIPYGWGFNFAFAPYGQQWRSKRRMFHQAFRAEASISFRPTQLRGARRLVLDILGTPLAFHDHVRRFAAGTITSIVYDYDVVPGRDPIVEHFERGTALAMEGLTPETASILEAFPFLLSLPEWFPGGVFRRKANACRESTIKFREEPFKHARKREAMDSTASAVAIDLLKRNRGADSDNPSGTQLVEDICATAFLAGAETSTSTLLFFILAMVQNPRVQERAHAEIDAVVGPNRPPTFDDRPKLPYIEAILMETLRMYTVVPLGLAHATTTDDIYEDFFIPKGKSDVAICDRATTHVRVGSTVVPNVWAMYHDKTAYPDPEVFKPERFFVDGRLNEKVKFVDSVAFGFGRRICPGRHTADGSVWAAVALILWACKMTKALNEQGKEIDFEPTFRSGVTIVLDPFPCLITSRQVKDIHELLAVDT